MDFRELGSPRPDELEDQCFRQDTRRYGAYDRDSTPRDCLEARSSLLAGRQRDPLSAAGVIGYALSYGTVHVADILYDKQFNRKTVALVPIVNVARNAVRRPEYDTSESYRASAGPRILSYTWLAHRNNPSLCKKRHVLGPSAGVAAGGGSQGGNRRERPSTR
jgi:hypothetical protein